MPAFATACSHTDRPHKARGLCKSCWSKEQRVNWAKSAAGAPAAAAATIAPKARPGRYAAGKAATAAVLTAPAPEPEPTALDAEPEFTASVAPHEAKVECSTAEHLVSKSNLSRHEKRNHSATPVFA